MFNIDGVELSNNQVMYVPGTIGRRGFNLDGSSNVKVVNNVLTMSVVPHPTDLGVVTPWAIQISMSDAAVQDVNIHSNTIYGTFRAIQGLSQRDLSSLKVSGNTITATRGIDLNTGGVIPVGAGSTFSDVGISGNKMTVSEFGVRLRDLHAPGCVLVPASPLCPGTKTIQFLDVDVTGNTVFDASVGGTAVVIVDMTNPNVVYDVKVKGNKLE